MRSRSPKASFVLLVLTVGLTAALSPLAGACTGKGSSSPNAQSVERQSDAEYDLARDLLQKDNPRAALDHAMKAIALNEDNDKAQYFVAVIYMKFCSTDAALDTPDCKLPEVEKYLRAALKANGEFRDAKNSLGAALVLQKKCKEAITVLEPLTKDPAYVSPYYAWGNLGDALLCDGQVDAAIAALKNSVAEPRFCVGHYRLGLAYEKKNDMGNAEASFTSSVSADPECDRLQDGWSGRCRIRKRANNPEWKKDCEKCREISAKTKTGKTCEALLGAPAPSPAAGPASSSGSSGRSSASLASPK